MSTSIKIPTNIGELLEKEARRRGLTLDEYLVEVALKALDPPARLKEYIRASKELLEHAREELRKGNVRQAAEKVWGAAALTIKAYAEWREGRRLASHRELWEYKEILVSELGDWVGTTFREAHSMHICFYEGWCTQRDVEDTLKHVRKLVAEVEKAITKSS